MLAFEGVSVAWLRKFETFDDLVEVKIGLRYLVDWFHVSLRLGILDHRLEVFPTLPLCVVHHTDSIGALMNVGRDETLYALHGLLRRLNQQVNQLALISASTVKTFTSVTTWFSFEIVTMILPFVDVTLSFESVCDTASRG